MNNTSKRQLIWGIRIIVSALFILSAVAKLYPSPLMGIQGFESKYLGALGIDAGLAKITSRLLIGFEFSIAILLLLPYYLKKIIIPSTITLLGIFSVHLLVQVIHGGSSNCGCFGELIPMTPLQALIKNILTIGLLTLPLTYLKDSFNDKENLHPVFYTGLIMSLMMFLLLPQGSSISGKKMKKGETVYSKYFDDIGSGNQILCFFAPTCEHCMSTGKQLSELKEKYPGLIPDIQILFMDETYPANGSEKEIADYFKFIGREFDYKVLETNEMNDIFWEKKNFPGVLYLYNGKERVFFDGTKENEFNSVKLINEIKREY
jgi:thiol-disulfide isomerase/thioredoxin